MQLRVTGRRLSRVGHAGVTTAALRGPSSRVSPALPFRALTPLSLSATSLSHATLSHLSARGSGLGAGVGAGPGSQTSSLHMAGSDRGTASPSAAMHPLTRGSSNGAQAVPPQRWELHFEVKDTGSRATQRDGEREDREGGGTGQGNRAATASTTALNIFSFPPLCLAALLLFCFPFRHRNHCAAAGQTVQEF